jgi:hypothetical protein
MYCLQLFVYESRDSDKETRNFGPVLFGVAGGASVDAVVAAMDQGWCFAYTCQLRLSSFWTYLPSEYFDLSVLGCGFVSPATSFGYFKASCNPNKLVKSDFVSFLLATCALSHYLHPFQRLQIDLQATTRLR